MKPTITLFLTLLSLIGFSQQITNVTAVQEGKQIVLTYDITGAGPADKLEVKLLYSQNNTNWHQATLGLTGDVGTDITPGTGKTMRWSPLIELNKLTGSDYIFKVRATVKPSDPFGIATKMVLVKGGTFNMGTDKFVEPVERPPHPVTVKNFWLAKTEVTFEDYDKFCYDTKRDTVSSAGWGRGKQPVIWVSWNDAIAYCNWLSGKEKLSKCYLIDMTGQVTYLDTAKGYRLPTEAEWEFAARGGNKSIGTNYAGSDNINDVVWYAGNSEGRAHPVAQKAPNELGLYDMNGNVWEWLWDIYDRNYYKNSPIDNPEGAATGPYRVMRGGAFYNNTNYAKVYTRQNSYVVFRQNSVGFRIARTYY